LDFKAQKGRCKAPEWAFKALERASTASEWALYDSRKNLGDPGESLHESAYLERDVINKYNPSQSSKVPTTVIEASTFYNT
jgi:hypothetical protein